MGDMIFEGVHTQLHYLAVQPTKVSTSKVLPHAPFRPCQTYEGRPGSTLQNAVEGDRESMLGSERPYYEASISSAKSTRKLYTKDVDYLCECKEAAYYKYVQE